MSIDWSITLGIVVILLNAIILGICIKGYKSTKAMIIVMSLLVPDILLTLTIGIVLSFIFILPIIPLSIFIIFLLVLVIIYFIRWNIRPQKIETSEHITKDIIQLDNSRRLLQTASFSYIINLVWFLPLFFLLSQWSIITATMMNTLSTDEASMNEEILVGAFNFLRTGGPLLVMIFIILLIIFILIQAMILTLTINGTVRFVNSSGYSTVNITFLALMVIPIVGFITNIIIIVKARRKLRSYSLNVSILEGERLGPYAPSSRKYNVNKEGYVTGEV